MSKILIFGGSSVYGYCDREGGWAQRLRTYADEANVHRAEDFHEVFNLGIYGDSTRNIVKRFDVEAEARLRLSKGMNNTVIIFQCGTNDSQYVRSRDSRRVPVEEFEQNIRVLLEKAKQMTEKVMIVGMSLVDESLTSPIASNPDIFFENESIILYDDILQRICRDQNVPYLAVRELAVHLSEDGIHQDSTGHRLIYELVRNFLQKNNWI
jgi:lysophospholipase L1-like esterase